MSVRSSAWFPFSRYGCVLCVFLGVVWVCGLVLRIWCLVCFPFVCSAVFCVLCVWFCLAVSISLVFLYVVGFRCMYGVLYDFSVCFMVVLWRVFGCFCCLFANVFCIGSSTYNMAVRQ